MKRKPNKPKQKTKAEQHEKKAKTKQHDKTAKQTPNKREQNKTKKLIILLHKCVFCNHLQKQRMMSTSRTLSCFNVEK